MDANGQNEDGVDAEEDESVDEYGLAVGREGAEFKVAVVAGELEQEARREQYK